MWWGWLIQEIQEVSKLGNADIPIAGKRKEMAVTGDDDVGLGEEGTLEDPIVRLILENMQMWLSLYGRGRLADRLEELLDLLIRPFEFGSEYVGGFGEDGEGSE
jgi:hypothetical protein